VRQAAKLVPAMSRKGNGYDPATRESFWRTRKLELVYRPRFDARTQARSPIFGFIECFDNPKRLHSALNFLSSVDFKVKNN
jgi:putative transposase